MKFSNWLMLLSLLQKANKEQEHIIKKQLKSHCHTKLERADSGHNRKGKKIVISTLPDA